MNQPAKKDTGIVLIHGKEYQTVAYRVKQFRESCTSLSLITEALKIDIDCVVVKASILDESGRVLATGHAEEYRSSSQINKTSALENAETSAIGRCLATFGFGGTEFATADEVAHAISGKPAAPQASGQGVKEAAMNGLTSARRKVLYDTAVLIKDSMDEGKDIDALGFYESITDTDERVAIWGLIASQHRSRLKQASTAANKKPEEA
jgi:hypothetical protein